MQGENNKGTGKSSEHPPKKGVRHAEKRRTATCQFADRVARLSIDHYHKLIPVDQRLEQTCLATIVSHNQTNGSLHVLGMGVGTKFLSEAVLRQESLSATYGMRIRDCHAEVLARRAFCRFLYLEIIRVLSLEGDSLLLKKNKNGTFELNSFTTLHMYTSSAPCGNAVLKKFSKMTKERFRDDLGPDEWPRDPHEPIHGHSVKMGQFALLVKKDNSLPGIPASDSVSIEPLKTTDGKKVWPANQSDDWTPPGTTIVTMNKGSLHTCSDKICRWNFLGLQGSLLKVFLKEPLYMSTLTVGRKLTECICRRAVCCRMGTYCQPTTSNITEGNEQIEYRINHPSILGTAVYMDESGAVETNPDIKGQDVRFHSSLSWAWWRSPEGSEVVENKQLECIDGNTGFLATTTEYDTHRSSKLSTLALSELFFEAQNMGEDISTTTAYSTLSSLRQLKENASACHEFSKRTLLAKHRVLRQWNRRSAAFSIMHDDNLS